MPRRRRSRAKLSSARGGGGSGNGFFVLLGIGLIVFYIWASSEYPSYANGLTALYIIAFLFVFYLWIQKNIVPRFRRKALADDSAAAFEKVCAGYLLQRGYVEVHISGGAYDRGIDIRCKDPDGQTVVVQCKKYRPDRKISPEPIRAFKGAMVGEHIPRGIFMTTAGFSREARNVASSLGIELIDGWQIAEVKIAREATA